MAKPWRFRIKTDGKNDLKVTKKYKKNHTTSLECRFNCYVSCLDHSSGTCFRLRSECRSDQKLNTFSSSHRKRKSYILFFPRSRGRLFSFWLRIKNQLGNEKPFLFVKCLFASLKNLEFLQAERHRTLKLEIK